MVSLTDAYTLHLIFEQADVENSQDYDLLVSLFCEIDLMIIDMEKSPSPLNQYEALLKKLGEDRNALSSRIDELQEQEVYLAEYFADDEDSEEEGYDPFQKGPNYEGADEYSYFATGTISWEFEPFSNEELMSSIGITWAETDNEDVISDIYDTLDHIFKYETSEENTQGREETHYGWLGWSLEIAEFYPNT